MHVKTIHQIPELRSWSLYVFLMKKKKPDSIWNGAFWLDDSFQKMPRVSILQILALISVYCRDLGDPFCVISYSFQIYVTIFSKYLDDAYDKLMKLWATNIFCCRTCPFFRSGWRTFNRRQIWIDYVCYRCLLETASSKRKSLKSIFRVGPSLLWG